MPNEPFQQFSDTAGGGFANQFGADVVAATTITPTGGIFRLTGATTVQTINLPYPTFQGAITIIPTGTPTMGTSGNIALGSTMVALKANRYVWNPITQKWSPSY